MKHPGHLVAGDLDWHRTRTAPAPWAAYTSRGPRRLVSSTVSFARTSPTSSPYLCRPPLGQQRLQRLHDGRVALVLQRPRADGTTHLLFTPTELLERLVPLVPRPRINLVLYLWVCATPSAIA
jgi:hypothetical protein